MTFDPNTFGMSYGFSEITIVRSGLLGWTPGLMSGLVYIDVGNTGNLTDSVSVYSTGCDLSANGTGAAILTSSVTEIIAASSITRFSFLAGKSLSTIISC